ncbi:MAG: hypothetical protein ACLR6B_13120 [Blautia sp.]
MHRVLETGLDTLKSGTTQYVSGANTAGRWCDSVCMRSAEQLAAGAQQLAALENLDQVSTGISQLNAAVSDGNSSLNKRNTAAGKWTWTA